MAASTPLNSEDSKNRTDQATGGKLWLGAIAILVLVLGMVASAYYQFPNGKSLDVGEFLRLWFREIFILVVLLVAVVIGGFLKLRKSSRTKSSGDRGAL